MPKRIAIAVPACLLLLAWGAWQFYGNLERARFLNADLGGTQTLITYDGPGRQTRDYGKQARVLSHDFFPPDHEGAARLYRQAIVRDPLLSAPWFGLAREELLLGHAGLARAALERSDALDPHYPKQRYDAIELWTLLDEPAKAVDVARKLSPLGGVYRANAARKLLDIGNSPAKVFAELNFSALGGDELVDALKVLHNDDEEAMRELWPLVDLAKLATPAQSSEIARLASAPMNEAVALKLWHRDNGLLNGLLQAPAFSTTYYFGWQTSTMASECRWLPPEEPGPNRRGRIEVVLGARSTERTFRWVFYRFPLAAGQAVEMTLHARQRLAQGQACVVVLTRDKEVVSQSTLSLATEDWQEVHLAVPPSSEASLIQITLVREALTPEARAKETPQKTSQINLGGLSVP